MVAQTLNLVVLEDQLGLQVGRQLLLSLKLAGQSCHGRILCVKLLLESSELAEQIFFLKRVSLQGFGGLSLNDVDLRLQVVIL